MNIMEYGKTIASNIDNPNALFRVAGVLYKVSKDKPALNDLVLDRKDGTFGYIDTMTEDSQFASVRDELAVEVGIPLERLVKLQPSIKE